MVSHKLQTLADLRVAETGRVKTLVGAPDVQQRLAEMGLTPGSIVQVVRFAPLGDPVQIAVRNYQLSLRRSETRCIVVEDRGCRGSMGNAA